MTDPPIPPSAPPIPDARTAFYWDAAREHRLAVLRCQGCGRWVHYPFPRCPACHGTTLAAEDVTGAGSVYSWTRMPEALGALPFVLVELDEQPGLRIAAWHSGPEVRVGDRAVITFWDYEEHTVPVFTTPA